MKIYTEEELRKHLYNHDESFFEELTPIELPSDDEAGVIALKIADTLKDKLTTEQESYFIAGFQTYSKWMKEQILNQNK